MQEYLREQDQQRAFLAGTRDVNPTNMREREAKIQRDWDKVGGDQAHVHSRFSLSCPRRCRLTNVQEIPEHEGVWMETYINQA